MQFFQYCNVTSQKTTYPSQKFMLGPYMIYRQFMYGPYIGNQGYPEHLC